MRPRTPFLPTARELNWLLVVGFLSLGYAMYLRYLAIEQSSVGLACDAGLATWLCGTRKIVTLLFTYALFGWAALAFAVAHVLRPHVVLFAAALAFAAFGLVLYNAGLAALAVGVLIAGFARPQRA
ncbi:MAG: hypothetical protein IT538_08070 [Variibacter sp.]|nr:hypothetical protein [Variibacter sp.]